MDSIGKHFGMNYREEAYIFKEHEKLRLASKRNALHLKQQPEVRPTVGRGLQGSRGVLAENKKGVISVRPEKPQGSPRAARTRPVLPQAPGGRPSDKTRTAAEPRAASFRPGEFYRSSSAFRRYQPQTHLPAIASRAGTARPMLLTSPPARRERPWDASVAPMSPPSTPSRSVGEPQLWKPSGKPDLLLLKDIRLGRKRDSSVSSVDSDLAGALLQSRVSIHPHFRRLSSSPSVDPDVDAAQSFSQTDKEPPVSPSQEQQSSAQPAGLLVPTLVEEIIASLHSEAQLASDKAFNELIWSILGPTYDFATEIEDVYKKKISDQKSPEEQAELELQIPQQQVSEEFDDVHSSNLQLEPEDTIEWAVSDAESMLKLQETLEIMPVSESSKPLEIEQSATDSKAAKRISLKEESSGLLQIRGKEIKHIKRAKFEISKDKRRKSLNFLRQKKLQTKRIPGEHTLPTLHALCKTVPEHQLPLHLSLASRVYHAPNWKGHDTVVGQLGASLFESCVGDEEEKDRLLYGIPNMDNEEENSTLFPVPPAHEPQLQLLGKEISAYPGFTKFLWNSAAPKFSVPVSVIKETVYPKYESAQASIILLERFSVFRKQHMISSDNRRFKNFILKKSASLENIQKHFSTESLQIEINVSWYPSWTEEIPAKNSNI